MSKYTYGNTAFEQAPTKHIIVECPEDGWRCWMHLLAEAPAKSVFCPRCYHPCREGEVPEEKKQ